METEDSDIDIVNINEISDSDSEVVVPDITPVMTPQDSPIVNRCDTEPIFKPPVEEVKEPVTEPIVQQAVNQVSDVKTTNDMEDVDIVDKLDAQDMIRSRFNYDNNEKGVQMWFNNKRYVCLDDNDEPNAMYLIKNRPFNFRLKYQDLFLIVEFDEENNSYISVDAPSKRSQSSIMKIDVHEKGVLHKVDNAIDRFAKKVGRFFDKLGGAKCYEWEAPYDFDKNQ